MRRMIAITSLLVMCFRPLTGQDMVEIFGYFEGQLTGSQIGNKFYQLYNNKLRLDIQSDYLENVTFAANFDYITYHGKKEWHILDFLPASVADKAPQDLRPYYMLRFEDEIFLDNAYITLRFELLDLTVGKQQISTGTGYVWNPTDVFNIKDLFDPTYEQPGHTAIQAEIPIGFDYNLSLLYTPEEDWNSSTKMLRFKGRLPRFDYTLIAIERMWTFYDYTQLDSVQGGFYGIPERRRLYGLSTVGELFEWGIWAEYAYNEMQWSNNFQELVVGVNYTFDFQTFVMFEYYHHTLGKTSAERYTLNDWMRTFTAEQKAISRDQLYILVQHPLLELMDAGLAGIVSLSDRSFALAPTISYSLWQDVDIQAYFSFNFGKDKTVYARDLGSGGLLRARIYF